MKQMMRSLMLAATAMFALVPAAGAHEKRPMQEQYEFVVGFVHEPAFAGQANGVDLTVRKAEGSEPVTGLEEYFKAKVSVPDKSGSVDLKFEKVYGKPGKYAAYFTPSAAGDYVFRITGSLSGKPVDETFRSGPGTFGSVREEVIFPDMTDVSGEGL